MTLHCNGTARCKPEARDGVDGWLIDINSEQKFRAFFGRTIYFEKPDAGSLNEPLEDTSDESKIVKPPPPPPPPPVTAKPAGTGAPNSSSNGSTSGSQYRQSPGMQNNSTYTAPPPPGSSQTRQTGQLPTITPLQ